VIPLGTYYSVKTKTIVFAKSEVQKLGVLLFYKFRQTLYRKRLLKYSEKMEVL